jgi:Tfp pilus assembly PilM family ATPase
VLGRKTKALVGLDIGSSAVKVVQFVAGGVYAVQLTIRNDAGEEASVSEDVTVAP